MCLTGSQALLQADTEAGYTDASFPWQAAILLQ